MSSATRSRRRHTPGFAFVLLCVWLGVLCLAGGSSRPDQFGQVIVRSAGWGLLVAVALSRLTVATDRVRPLLWLLGAAAVLLIMQLIPLPAALWAALPGRQALAQGLVAEGLATARPMSLVPGATLNALASLVVPATTIALMAALRDSDRRFVPLALLAIILLGMLVGLLQLSGVVIDNPFVNDTAGHIAGTFANRNHFAVALAIGCVLVPFCAVRGGRASVGWGIVAVGLIVLLFLTVLGTGSRAGMIAVVVAFPVGLAVVKSDIRRMVSGNLPRWVLPLAMVIGVVVVVAAIGISIALGRAESIRRAVDMDVGEDFRRRGLPTVLAMIREYFPFGSGAGSFDVVFRIHEPFALLKPTYFNHAHNDYLEIALDSGLPGVGLLLTALVWSAIATVAAWRSGATAPCDTERALARLGSAVVGLVAIASVVDYPARTPLVMAIVTIAAIWLAEWLSGVQGASALPRVAHHL